MNFNVIYNLYSENEMGVILEMDICVGEGSRVRAGGGGVNIRIQRKDGWESRSGHQN